MDSGVNFSTVAVGNDKRRKKVEGIDRVKFFIP